MFDTVNFWIPSDKYIESEILENWLKKSIVVNEVYLPKDDAHIYSCSIKNYKVRMNQYGIFINGSIAKYLFNDDTIKFANRLSYKHGIEELFELLNLDINNVLVRRVDVGQNLKLNQHVLHYYPLLVTASRLKRELHINSLYFRNKSRELIFYDKATERSEKGFKKFSGNLLRYELKLKKNPSYFLKSEKVYAKNLYDKGTYEQLLNLWYDSFKKIRKATSCTYHLDFNNAKDLKNNLAALALSNYELDIFKKIESKISKGEINSINAHRCRKLIIELQSSKSVKVKGDDLLKELNSKMQVAYKHCLKTI